MLQRKPALIAIAAVVLLVGLITFLVVSDNDDDNTDSARRAGSETPDKKTEDGDDGTPTTSSASSSSSTSTAPTTGTDGGTGPASTNPDGGTGGAPSSVAPTTAPGGGSGSVPTTSTTTIPTPTEAQGVCGAYNVIEAAAELVFNSGDLGDADLVSRAHELADDLERASALLRSNAEEPYGDDAVMYADFLAPMGSEFRAATTRAEVDAAGEKLFAPPDDVSEADNRLQIEYDAGCQD